MIVPKNNYILIEDLPTEEKTDGGIYLPTKRLDKPALGLIYKAPDALGLEKGVKVWYRQWADEPLEYEGKKLKAIHEKDLIAYEEVNNK